MNLLAALPSTLDLLHCTLPDRALFAVVHVYVHGKCRRCVMRPSRPTKAKPHTTPPAKEIPADTMLGVHVSVIFYRSLVSVHVENVYNTMILYSYKYPTKPFIRNMRAMYENGAQQ